MPAPKDSPLYRKRRAAEEALIDEISRAAQCIADARDLQGQPVFPTDSVWRVLNTVARSHYCLAIADLGRALRCSRQAAQRLAHTAARAGVIRLEPNPDDKRILQALLTPMGRSQLAFAEVTRRHCLGELLIDFTAHEMAAATNVVRVIRQRLERSARELAQRDAGSPQS